MRNSPPCQPFAASARLPSGDQVSNTYRPVSGDHCAPAAVLLLQNNFNTSSGSLGAKNTKGGYESPKMWSLMCSADSLLSYFEFDHQTKSQCFQGGGGS